ncbi:hypothetical protein F4819DRAFT_485197 [Hypoxylon fuscum]|nr:hypothetical protein F4819DRAFT_485197 [Hypoxylon fuscum]
METFYQHSRFYRERSNSAPPTPTPFSEPSKRVNLLGESQAYDLETVTYHEARDRWELQHMKEECSKWITRLGKLHNRGHRANPDIKNFIMASINYAQELLTLKFHLVGPDKIHFIPEKDRKAVMASIDRVKLLIMCIGWRFDYMAVLFSAVNNAKATEKLVWSEILWEWVDTGKKWPRLNLKAFWDPTRPLLDGLNEELNAEIPRMRRLMDTLEIKNQNDKEFLKEASGAEPEDTKKDDKKASSTGRTWKMPGNIPYEFNIQFRHEMSGAAHRPKPSRLPVWFNNIIKEGGELILDCIKDQASLIEDYIPVAPAPAWAWTRYKSLKGFSKLCTASASVSMWKRFHKSLSKKEVPSTGFILLKHRVVTEIILAEHQAELKKKKPQQQQEEDSGDTGDAEGHQENIELEAMSGGQAAGAEEQTEDAGWQTDDSETQMQTQTGDAHSADSQTVDSQATDSQGTDAGKPKADAGTQTMAAGAQVAGTGAGDQVVEEGEQEVDAGGQPEAAEEQTADTAAQNCDAQTAEVQTNDAGKQVVHAETQTH